jgi:hypothetical protein
MATEIVFTGGHRVITSFADAKAIIRNLNRATVGPVQTPTGWLAEGWVDIETDEGVIFVSPSQVAYVRDLEDMPEAEETRRSLSGLEPRQVRA